MTIKPWLDKAGAFTVEHIPCPHFSQPVALDSARTGVLHTTEGGWEGSLGVFKSHYAPHFMVGMDSSLNKVRIAQLVQVGTIGAALVTHNWLAIVQVEMIGFSKETPWTPDDETAQALASLMAVCKAEYGIPLVHPWADGDFGRAGDNPHRHAGKWGIVAGWYGHADCPSPDTHWDPGNLQWSKILAAASAMTGVVDAPAWTPPPPPPRPCACGQHAPDLSTIKGIQQALISLGLNVGEAGADDEDGPDTQGAIKAFQRFARLRPTGIADQVTKAALAKEIAGG
jgi:hypothetical protein